MPDFDGVKIEEKIFCDTPTEFKITLGRGKTQEVWNDQATVSFDDFAEELSQSPAGPKDGTCYTPAIFSGNKRNKQEAVEIGIAALDADCGHSFDEIIEALGKTGLEAIVHSTYCHDRERPSSSPTISRARSLAAPTSTFGKAGAARHQGRCCALEEAHFTALRGK